MAPTQPYQPLLLRILHGLTGIFLIAAILTAFWTYDVYDGRWGRIPLPDYKGIEGLHGTFGLYTLLLFPAFVIYAFHQGRKRLVQSDSIRQLSRIGKPIWWYTLSRFTNTLTLLALTFALFSGKMMDETWLPKGELNHTWYYAHLVSWVVMVVAIALHLLMNAKIGGSPLLLSMVSWHFRQKDSPKLWATHLSNYLANGRSRNWQNFWQNRLQSKFVPLILETIILLSLTMAWAIALAKELPFVAN